MTSSGRSRAAFVILLVATLAWSTLAFGAVYAWAYTPMFAALAVLGVWGLVAPADAGRRASRGLAAALAVFGLAILLQLIPLSHAWLVAISPAADAFLRRYDLGYAISAGLQRPASHPLSIDPSNTLLAFGMYCVSAVFFVGLTRTLDGSKLRLLAPAVVALGVVLALVGIIQEPVFTGRIYGFWTPEAGLRPFTRSGGPYGPFVNRNHFAGWMLMAVPLALGYLCALVARARRDRVVRRSGRLAWLASRDAVPLWRTLLAIVVMSLALIATFSRSGIACVVIGIAVVGIAAISRRIKRRGRAAAASALVAAAIFGVGWIAATAMNARFHDIDWTFNGRVFVWHDALLIHHAFPLAGTGLNSYGTATILYQTYQTTLYHYAQAHNDYLQLLAEGGLLLVVPAAVVAALFVRELWQRFREGADDSTSYWLRIGAVAGIVAMACQEIVDFSLEIPADAMLFLILCAIAVRKTTGGWRSDARLMETR